HRRALVCAAMSVVISLALLGGSATAAPVPPITAYVTNSASNTLTPIDLATNTPGAQIPAGQLPAWVAITPAGQTAYVTDAESDSVTPIDLATNTPGAAITGDFQFPAFEAITPDGKADYVTNFRGSSVTPIDLATNTPGAEIKVGAFARGIAIAPDGKTAYVANFGSDSVTPIDVATNTPGAEIKVVRPSAITITPHGNTATATK